MSVALLSGNKDVQVCDELESFFYVLLYFATRYLHSPLPDITTANYLDEFFDHYGVGEGRYVCGDKKKNTIANGCLEVADTVMLRFDSNMDDVLADILSWFKAHHEVTRHEAEKAKAEAKAAASRHQEKPRILISTKISITDLTSPNCVQGSVESCRYGGTYRVNNIC